MAKCVVCVCSYKPFWHTGSVCSNLLDISVVVAVLYSAKQCLVSAFECWRVIRVEFNQRGQQQLHEQNPAERDLQSVGLSGQGGGKKTDTLKK